ncbi:MAG TPA: transglycosylase SLT domain-containing protein [Candidatus Dormibacteraeota bacterium]|nr:transglycosylase SLT domain-containing protein [Candidatus Dormibacteraeota bacterium]
MVSAVDPDGSKWSAIDLQKASRPAYRRLTHSLVLLAALVPISVTMASAHQSVPQPARITINPNPVDSKELSTAIPADPTPPPAPPPPAPTAKPAPAAAPVSRPVNIAPSQQAVADIIRAAAAKWGADPNQLLRVAMCESHLNPNSYNPAGYYGLFQFNPNTFKAHGGTNIWDATDQANIAAHMFAQGLASEWGCK